MIASSQHRHSPAENAGAYPRDDAPAAPGPGDVELESPLPGAGCVVGSDAVLHPVCIAGPRMTPCRSQPAPAGSAMSISHALAHERCARAAHPSGPGTGGLCSVCGLRLIEVLSKSPGRLLDLTEKHDRKALWLIPSGGGSRLSVLLLHRSHRPVKLPAVVRGGPWGKRRLCKALPEGSSTAHAPLVEERSGSGATAACEPV